MMIGKTNATINVGKVYSINNQEFNFSGTTTASNYQNETISVVFSNSPSIFGSDKFLISLSNGIKGFSGGYKGSASTKIWTPDNTTIETILNQLEPLKDLDIDLSVEIGVYLNSSKTYMYPGYIVINPKTGNYTTSKILGPTNPSYGAVIIGIFDYS